MGRKDSRCQDPEKRACLMHSRESRGVNIKQQGQLYWEARDVGARPSGSVTIAGAWALVQHVMRAQESFAQRSDII